MRASPYELTIADYNQNFEKYWHKIFTEYRNTNNEDCLWLAGPSSYVFSLCKTRFAVDLQIRRKCDFEALRPTLSSELSDLSFVLITHQHDDHMCIPLMRELKDTDIKWYIPEGVSEDLISASEIKKENIIKVRSGDVFTVGDITVRAFFTPHVYSGIVEIGYELSTPHGKILMPADIRDYGYNGYPDFGEVDLCISHLWAGNNALDEVRYMPLIEDFANFFAKFSAKRYLLCHLYEIGREELYMWHDGHAELAIKKIKARLPLSVLEIPRLGEKYNLF